MYLLSRDFQTSSLSTCCIHTYSLPYFSTSISHLRTYLSIILLILLIIPSIISLSCYFHTYHTLYPCTCWIYHAYGQATTLTTIIQRLRTDRRNNTLPAELMPWDKKENWRVGCANTCFQWKTFSTRFFTYKTFSTRFFTYIFYVVIRSKIGSKYGVTLPWYQLRGGGTVVVPVENMSSVCLFVCAYDVVLKLSYKFVLVWYSIRVPSSTRTRM